MNTNPIIKNIVQPTVNNIEYTKTRFSKSITEQKLHDYVDKFEKMSPTARHTDLALDQTLIGTLKYPMIKKGIDAEKGIIQQASEKLIRHRQPNLTLRHPMTSALLTVQDYMKLKETDESAKTFLTDARDQLVKKDPRYNKEGATEKDKLYTLSELKEQYNEIVYANKFKANVESHLYEPTIMTAEMMQLLKCSSKIPKNIDSNEAILKELAREIQRYEIDGGEIPILSKENTEHLIEELADIIQLYQEVYKDKNLLDTFVLCRDLVRIAAYQMLFDKSVFTGSDHGVLHIHHNCKNGHNMHKEMEKNESKNPKAALLSKIVHFYHDIGYSVGAAEGSFPVMKDHPFIGAAFIDANIGYFNKLLGETEAVIVKRCILNHAIVSFDSKDVNDLYKLVRFTTSNSDACAVAGDQKAQKFWRDNPETILELAKLKLFMTIFPECAGVLGHENIIKAPQLAMANWLINPNLSTKKTIEEWLKDPAQPTPAVFEESNFKDPVYFKAYTVFTHVKKKLLEIAKKEHLPMLEQEAFEKAILNNFNHMGSEIVIKQFGAELIETSIERNDPTNIARGEPKYLPKITIGPSLLYAVIEDCFGPDTAGGNIRKVLIDEYGAEKDLINRAINAVGESKSAGMNDVSSCVARIYIQRQQDLDNINKTKQKYTNVIDTLEKTKQNTVPVKFRETINAFADTITPKENKSKDPTHPKDEKDRPLVKIGDKYYLENFQEKSSQLLIELTKEPPTNITNEQFDEFIITISEIALLLNQDKIGTISQVMILQLRSLISTNKDWDFMGSE